MLEHQRTERVPVERREEEIAHTDVELDGLHVGLTGRNAGRLLFLDEERADQSTAKIGEREPLWIGVALRFATADDEVDEGVVRTTAIDRECRDTRADDNRKREEAFADDSAEGLKASDALPNAFEPTVRADSVEGELSFGFGHGGASRQERRGSVSRFPGRFQQRHCQCRQTGNTPQPSHRFGSLFEGQRWSIPR